MDYITLLPMLIMFVLFYFMLIRPQKKAAEAKQKMIQGLAEGDAVVTIGGLHAIVDEVNQTEGLVILDCEGVYLTYELNAIANVIKTASSDLISENVEESTQRVDDQEEVIISEDEEVVTSSSTGPIEAQ